MGKFKYSKSFRLQVVQEALLPENEGLEHVVAQKYAIQPWTVRRWVAEYREHGEEALGRGYLKSDKISEREKQLAKENAELREEIEILKKAAAFLADLRRE